jgi:hypothetical protein
VGSPSEYREFTIRNDYFGPIEVEVTLAEQTNVQASPALPRKFVVQPGVSKPLFALVEIFYNLQTEGDIAPLYYVGLWARLANIDN